MQSKFDFNAGTQGGARPGGPQQTVLGSVTEQQKQQACKRMQNILFWLLHADSCQQAQNSGQTSQCMMPTCEAMREVLTHVKSCQAGKNCVLPRCWYCWQLLNHWNNCNKKECPVCQPIRRLKQNKQINATPLHAAPKSFEADVRRAYSYLETLGTSTFPTSSVIMIPRPSSNRQSMLGPMVLFQTNAMPSQLMGDGSKSGAKDWLSITAETRNYMIYKVVCAIFRPKDPTDPRLVAYARKVEDEAYKMASTSFDYYDLLDEKVYKIQKEMEEKRQKQKKPISKL